MAKDYQNNTHETFSISMSDKWTVFVNSILLFANHVRNTIEEIKVETYDGDGFNFEGVFFTTFGVRDDIFALGVRDDDEAAASELDSLKVKCDRDPSKVYIKLTRPCRTLTDDQHL